MSMINIFQEKLNIQREISLYFGDLVMTKVKEIEGTQYKPSYSLYYGRPSCMLCNDDRYIIVVIERDPFQIGFQTNLSNLNWISFQTRVVEKPPMKIRPQQVVNPITGQTLTDRIFLTEKRSDRNVYMAKTLPLKIELLFTDKDGDSYSETGTLQSALDTFNCVLSFTI